MKKLLVVGLVGLSTLLVGCGSEEMTNQAHERAMLKMQQDHELNMARLQMQPVQQVAPQQQVSHGNTDYVQPAPTTYSDVGYDGVQPASSGESDSGIGSTILAVGAGALAGYAISELLDDGYRSYSDNTGRTVYVDKNGRQIDKRDYDAYKAKHPTKHKLSEYNQKGKQAINTGAAKTVEAGKAVQTKTVEAAKKVDQKVVQPAKQAVQKKTSSFKKSSSSKRK